MDNFVKATSAPVHAATSTAARVVFTEANQLAIAEAAHTSSQGGRRGLGLTEPPSTVVDCAPAPASVSATSVQDRLKKAEGGATSASTSKYAELKDKLSSFTRGAFAAADALNATKSGAQPVAATVTNAWMRQDVARYGGNC